MNRNRHKEEVSEEAFAQAIKGMPGTPIFGGEIYTVADSNGSITWNKPVAIKENGKFYLVRE